jgi:hypothetical protein
MRSGLLLTIIGFLTIGAAAALAEDRILPTNQVVAAVAPIQASQTVIQPVRVYTYYGAPGWYQTRPYVGPYRYYTPYRPYRYWSYYTPEPYYGYYTYPEFGFSFSGPRRTFSFGF